MLQLGLTMEVGTVSRWFKHEGDTVKAGEAILEVTTDKLANEVTSEYDGVLLKIVAQEGEDIPVKGLLGYVGKAGEQVGSAVEHAAALAAETAPASAMGEVAAENIMGIPAVYNERTNPTCVYIEPEAASVGLAEEQCKAQGIDYKVGRFPMAANGKALILNGGEGTVKILAGKQYGEILGMHIIGPRATDLIAEGALAIAGEMTLDELIATIHSHPTVTETMRKAALQAEGRAIHAANKTEKAE